MSNKRGPTLLIMSMISLFVILFLIFFISIIFRWSNKSSETDLEYLPDTESSEYLSYFGDELGDIIPREFLEVTDGDKIKVDYEGQPHYIRLYGIDAPELDQPWGPEAKTFIESQLPSEVLVEVVKPADFYKRILGIVFYGDEDCKIEESDGFQTVSKTCRNLNTELLSNGLAWWDESAATKEDEYRFHEAEARFLQKGLWKENEPIAPWDWRKGVRTYLLDTDGKWWCTEKGSNKVKIRHNSKCRWFKKGKSGKFCGEEDGITCSMCGG